MTSQHSRGSVLIMTYFVMVVFLGLAVPQAMRSIQSLQLESRYVVNKQFFHASEAGVDYVMTTILPANASFGDLTDTSVPACPTNATWDCWTQSLQLPGGYVVQFRASDLGPPTGTTVKRIRIIASRPASTTQVGVQEVVVSVTRRMLRSEVRAGTRLVIQTGNGVERNILQGDEIRVYGPVTGNSWTDIPVAVHGNQAIWGKVWVKRTNGQLCCNNVLNPPPEVSLATGNTFDGGRIRKLDYDINGVPVGGIIVASKGQGLTGLPEQPDFLPAGEDTYTFTPVKMQYGNETTNCLGDVGGVGNPGGIAGAVVTFCPSDDNTGPCFGSGDNANPIFHNGVRGPGGIVEYCVRSLWGASGGSVRFKGDNVRVYATAYQDYSGVHKAYAAAANSAIYAFKSNPADLTESGTGALTLGVLESNRWVKDPVTNEWVPDSADNWGKDLPSGAMVPEAHFSGDFLYGTVKAPRSEVYLNMNNVDTRGAGSMIGGLVSISGIVRVRPESESVTPFGMLEEPARFVGWRKCALSTPSDSLSACMN